MANEEYINILQEGSDIWNRWRKTNPLLKLIDLSGADLIGANLVDVNFVGVDLRDANLNRANLSGANLEDANLSRANLGETTLRLAYLVSSKLARADLSFADLIGANLTGADLTGANLRFANLNRAIFIGADLTGADLFDANVLTKQFTVTQLSLMKTHFQAASSKMELNLSNDVSLKDLQLLINSLSRIHNAFSNQDLELHQVKIGLPSSIVEPSEIWNGEE